MQSALQVNCMLIRGAGGVIGKLIKSRSVDLNTLGTVGSFNKQLVTSRKGWRGIHNVSNVNKLEQHMQGFIPEITDKHTQVHCGTALLKHAG